MQPPASSFRDIYLSAFSRPVWIVCIFMLVIFVVCLIVMDWLYKKYGWNHHTHDPMIEFEDADDAKLNQDVYGPFYYVLLTVGIFCQQGIIKYNAMNFLNDVQEVNY